MTGISDPHHVLSITQMAQADHLATLYGNLPSFSLMQSAGAAVADDVRRAFGPRTILVLCGPGNNGGDGYIAAMHLAAAGMDVRLYALVPRHKLTGDAAKAAAIWCDDHKGPVRNFSELLNDLEHADFSAAHVGVVDAVFGAGLSRALEFPVSDAFDRIRGLDLPVLAVDVPSGVYGDTGAVDPHALRCAATITFFRKKPAHLLLPGAEYCGLVGVADIGIPDDVLRETGCVAVENNPGIWADMVPAYARGAHKYGRGHVMVLGGARLTGAARLAAAASMRAGAGVCSIAAPKAVQMIYQTGPAHIMVEPSENADDFLKLAADSRRNTLLIGPGAGQDNMDGLRLLVRGACALPDRAVVLDADAITAFAGMVDNLCAITHARCVLTPHEGEFSRVFGHLTGSKIDRARAAAAQSGAVILLKGADTVIAAPDGEVVISTHAPSWLATAGAGDVLAGIIAGLLAQGVAPFIAAQMGAWIHGESAWRLGPGLVAADLAEGIPGILRDWA